MFLSEEGTCCLSKNWSGGIPSSFYSKFANRKMQILLVEDNPLIQHIHRVMLSKVITLIELQGKIDVASTGEEALEMAKEHDYDLIFLDIRLPGISGTEVAQQLRMSERHAQTRLIALTTIYENAKDYLLAGIEEVLPKPTNMEKFKATICGM